MTTVTERQLTRGTNYAFADNTPAGVRLSLLMSGRLSVFRDVNGKRQFLHDIYPLEWMDSLEWERYDRWKETFSPSYNCPEEQGPLFEVCRIADDIAY